jgi:beta-lactamase class A
MTIADLKYSIERIAKGVNADWGIYAKFVESGEEIAINADLRMDTMSVIKIPLLLTLFLEQESGHVDFDERLTLLTEHKRFGTGVLKVLDNGLQLSLRDAAVLMIIQSDNTGTDIIFDAVGGPGNVTRAMQELGLNSIEASGWAFDWFRALSMTMDPSYADLSPEDLFEKGYPSLTPQEIYAARESFHFEGNHPFGLSSARDMGRLLEMIWYSKCASHESCNGIQRILRLQQFRTRIPKYLFAASVAHKTGDFEPFIANDVGVIEPFGRSPVIVCFFSAHHRGIWANLEDAIARMSEKVWEYSLSL